MADGIDGAALVGNLGIDYLQVFKAFLDVLAVGLKLTLLFLNLALQLLALGLKSFYRRLLTSGFCLFAIGGRLLLLCCLRGTRLLLRRLASLCRHNSAAEQPTADGEQPE